MKVNKKAVMIFHDGFFYDAQRSLSEIAATAAK